MQSKLLADSVLQCLSSLEGRDLHRWDGDLLARIAWVHAHASSTVRKLERSETRDGDGRTLLEVLHHKIDDGLKSVAGCTLGDAGSVRDGRNEILLGHKRGRKREVKDIRILKPQTRVARRSKQRFWLAEVIFSLQWLS